MTTHPSSVQSASAQPGWASCLACGTRAVSDRYLVGCYTYARCCECCTIRLEADLSDDDIFRLYSDYRVDVMEGEALPEYMQSADLVGRLFLNHYQGRRGSLLDVGCGLGLFLRVAQSSFRTVMGQEISPQQAEFCRRQGLPVSQSQIAELRKDGARFDAITCWEVIEHLRDPRLELAEMASLLHPGGHLWLSTPNATCLSSQLCGSSWRPLNPPEHLRIFSKQALLQLGKEAGLEPVRAFSRTVDVFSIASSMLGRTISGKRAVNERKRSAAVRLIRNNFLLRRAETLVNGLIKNTSLGDALYLNFRKA